jgi:hypothetical protein
MKQQPYKNGEMGTKLLESTTVDQGDMGYNSQRNGLQLADK